MQFEQFVIPERCYNAIVRQFNARNVAIALWHRKRGGKLRFYVSASRALAVLGKAKLYAAIGDPLTSAMTACVFALLFLSVALLSMFGSLRLRYVLIIFVACELLRRCAKKSIHKWVVNKIRNREYHPLAVHYLFLRLLREWPKVFDAVDFSKGGIQDPVAGETTLAPAIVRSIATAPLASIFPVKYDQLGNTLIITLLIGLPEGKIVDDLKKVLEHLMVNWSQRYIKWRLAVQLSLDWSPVEGMPVGCLSVRFQPYEGTTAEQFDPFNLAA